MFFFPFQGASMARVLKRSIFTASFRYIYGKKAALCYGFSDYLCLRTDEAKKGGVESEWVVKMGGRRDNLTREHK